MWERKFGEKLPTLASVQKKKLKEEINKLTEKLSKSDIKKMRDKFNKTGKLPPHLKKLADLMDKHKEVEDIVVPGLEWMADIKEGKLTELQTFPPFEIAKRMLKNKKFGDKWAKQIIRKFRGRGVSEKSLNKFLSGKFSKKDIGAIWGAKLEGKLNEGVPETILKQISRRTLNYIGANTFVKGRTGEGEYMQFNVKGRRLKTGGRIQVIYSSGKDNYVVKAWMIRGSSAKLVKQKSDIHIEVLDDVIEDLVG